MTTETVLAAIPRAGSIELELDGRRIRLSNLDKVLWPETGFTKADLVSYYAAVAPALLPRLRGRALTLGRWPKGVEAPGFAQTECRGRPEWLQTAPVRLRSGEIRHHCLAEDRAGLLWIANQNAIELHGFLHLRERPSSPEALLFDLDPGARRDVVDCCGVALALRERLGDAGFSCHLRTTGSRGLHVLAPAARLDGYAATREFSRRISDELARRFPALVASARGEDDRVYIDWAQNHPSRTTILPYSLRSTARPGVSTPLSWSEVELAWETKDARVLDFSPAEVLDRVQRGPSRYN